MKLMTLGVLLDTIDLRALAAFIAAVEADMVRAEALKSPLHREMTLASLEQAHDSLMYAWNKSEALHSTPAAFAEAWDTFMATVTTPVARRCEKGVRKSITRTLRETSSTFVGRAGKLALTHAEATLAF